MSETRAGKYGRNLAGWIHHTFSTLPVDQRDQYKTQFIQELRTYSFEPRPDGTPANAGCVYELSDIVTIDIGNPRDLAKLVKESIHLMYQKKTAARVMEALLQSL